MNFISRVQSIRHRTTDLKQNKHNYQDLCIIIILLTFEIPTLFFHSD